MKYKRCTISRCGDRLRHIYAQRVVIVRPGYKHFLMSNFADGKNILHDSHFIETYLVNNSDRDRGESPEKSMVGDRNDGSQKWKSLGLNHPPFSTQYFNKSTYCHHSAISGTTTGISFSLTITEHTLHQTIEKTFDIKN